MLASCGGVCLRCCGGGLTASGYDEAVRRASRAGWLCALGSALLAACQCSTHAPEQTYRCSEPDDCAGGFGCVDGVCVSTSESGGGSAAGGGSSGGGASRGGGGGSGRGGLRRSRGGGRAGRPAGRCAGGAPARAADVRGRRGSRARG